jgi:hypothetical protein
MTKRNTGVLWSVTQSLNADEKKQAQDNMGLDTLYSGANSDNAGKYVKRVYKDSNGKIVTVQSDTNSSFNYNDPGTAPINGVGVKAAIDSITVKVDDDTAALNRLMVTSKNNDAIFGNNFFSGLKKVSPAGHPEYSYVSVNCGEGLFVDGTTSSDSFGKLSLSKATSDKLGGIRVGYTSSGDNIAVQINNNGQGYVTVPISDIESEIAALRVFSSISVNTGGTSAFVISPTNNNSTLKLTTDGNITLTQPTSTTDTIQLNYTLPAATSSVLGGIKTGFASTLTDEKYAVQLTIENKAYVAVDDMFKLTEGSYSTTPKGVHMILTCSSPTNGAAISITNRSGTLVNWPSKSASADPIGYLLPTFATDTTGKRLVLDNGSVKWVDDATVYTAGTDIKIVNNKISVNTTGTTSASNAFVIGDSTNASGTNSFAGGTSSKATNINTFAFGANNTVSGHDSIALGSSNNVLGAYSTAIGHYHVIPAYENNAGGTIAIGMNLNCTYPNVIYMGNYNTGDTKEYGAVRVTGQGYAKGGSIQSRDIELLYGDGLLELYSGYRTTSYILSGGNGKYSTLQSSYQVLGQGKNEGIISGFRDDFYSPLLHIEDRYTYRETPNEARIISSTLSRDGLVVNAYDEIGGTSVNSAYIARYTPEQIEFESSTCGINILIPEKPKVPAWSGSTTSEDMSAARIALKSVNGKWANLKTGTISVRFFRASELTYQHPLVPSEEEGELTFIYNDYTAGSSSNSDFYIWDRYTKSPGGDSGPEKKSGYITQNNFCIMMTVEASKNIGQQGSFDPGVFALLTADSESQAASDPTVVVAGFGHGYSDNLMTPYDKLSKAIGFSNNKVVKMFIIDNQLQVPQDMQLTAYYAGMNLVDGHYSYYFQCCGHMYRCDYNASTTSHTNWSKVF